MSGPCVVGPGFQPCICKIVFTVFYFIIYFYLLYLSFPLSQMRVITDPEAHHLPGFLRQYNEIPLSSGSFPARSRKAKLLRSG